jgi:hypothetical protein
MGIGGIHSHVHTWFDGPRLAKETIFSGMRLPARRLYEFGQVDRLYSDTEVLHAGAIDLPERLQRTIPSPSVKQSKQSTSGWTLLASSTCSTGRRNCSTRCLRCRSVSPTERPNPRLIVPRPVAACRCSPRGVGSRGSREPWHGQPRVRRCNRPVRWNARRPRVRTQRSPRERR